MIKRLCLLAIAVVAFSAARAQYVPVFGTGIQDVGGTPLSQGQICWQATDANGAPVGIQVGAVGQAIPTAKCFAVRNGAFSGRVADVTTSSPANVCYSVTVKTQATSTPNSFQLYSCAQPSASITDANNNWCSQKGCNTDLLPQANVQSVLPGAATYNAAGPIGPQGIQGPPGCIVGGPPPTGCASIQPFGDQNYLRLDGGNTAQVSRSISSTSQFVNGIPQADQFPGQDMCVKLRAANVYALAQGLTFVDATHFTGTQTCSVDPVNNLMGDGQAVNLTILLGSVHIQTQVPWHVNNSNLTIRSTGGPSQTQLEYVGASLVPAVFNSGNYITAQNTWSYYVKGLRLEGLFIYGDAGNATDAIYITGTHHATFKDVWTWGATSCGFESFFAVTDTWYTPRTSDQDAADIGIKNATHTQPLHGLCLGGPNTSFETTNGVVIDVAAEGLAGTGLVLTATQNMTFEAGTSEGNGGDGIDVGRLNTATTFTGIDLESNAGDNIQDHGTSTVLINPIMDQKHIVVEADSIGFYRLGGNLSPIVYISGEQLARESFGTQEPQGFQALSAGAITNSAGFQIASAPGCAVPAGATSCTTKVILPVPTVDGNFLPVCSAVIMTAGSYIGNIQKIGGDVTDFTVETHGVGGGGNGFVVCLVAHN